MRGLTKTDAADMTLGMWLDYIIEYNRMMDDAHPHNDAPHRATQKDIDALAAL